MNPFQITRPRDLPLRSLRRGLPVWSRLPVRLSGPSGRLS